VTSRLLALVWPDLRAPEADVARFEPMLDALDDLSPRVEAVDVGVALVDVTGLEALHGPERRVAARAVALVRAVAPLAVRCGVGDNRWLAVLAARLARFERPEAPAAFHALPVGRDAQHVLRELPLSLLPADPATRQRFALFGLTEMGQLADLPRSAVGAQFGAIGEQLQALARGEDRRPLVPRRRPERLERSATFDPPLDGIGGVGLTLRRLAAELCERLAGRGLAPGRAVLELRLEDAPVLRVAQPFPQPALEPDWIARLLLSRIEAAARARRSGNYLPAELTDRMRSNRPAPLPFVAPRGNSPPRAPPKLAVSVAGGQLPGGDETTDEEPRVASVHLTLDRLSDPATQQIPAFEARAGRWEELRWSLERIRHRFGKDRLWRAVTERPAASLAEQRSRLVDIGP
jgi:nucleotidyltransferase/DNA polymerase involved in DNA repair